jgi:hypothetical protein
VILLNINTLKIGVFFYFIAYGYYGAVVPKNYELDLISLLITIALSLFFVVYSRIPSPIINEFDVKISISKKTLIIFAVIVASIFLVFYDNLQHSLFSDELSYSKSAHRHGLEITFLLYKLYFLADIQARYIIQFISIISLLHLYLIWKAIDNNKYIAVIITLFILYRLAIDFKGGSANPHPPLELITILVSGSLFGITDIGLKMSYFLTYFLFHLLIYISIKRSLGVINSSILIFIIATIPLISQFSFVIEHAVWGYFFTSMILLEVTKPGNVQLHRIIPLVAIGVLFRQSILVLTLPILLLFIWENGLRGISTKRNYFSLYILIIAFPIFLNSLLYGTPVSNAISDIDVTQNFNIIFNSTYLIDSFNNSFGYIWMPIFLFAFIPDSKKNIPTSITIFLLFIIFYYIYHLIDHNAWELDKYKAEYFAPFILLGFIKLAKLIQKTMPNFVLPVVLTIFFLISLNLNGSHTQLKVDQECPTLGKYDYKKAYNHILEAGDRGSTYSIGATYGVLPEVIAGYSVSQLNSAKSVYSEVQQLNIVHPVTIEEIEKIFHEAHVKYILVPRNLVLNNTLLGDDFNFDIIFGNINSANCGELLILKKK